MNLWSFVRATLVALVVVYAASNGYGFVTHAISHVTAYQLRTWRASLPAQPFEIQSQQ